MYYVFKMYHLGINRIPLKIFVFAVVLKKLKKSQKLQLQSFIYALSINVYTLLKPTESCLKLRSSSMSFQIYNTSNVNNFTF